MKKIRGKSILVRVSAIKVRVSEGSSYRKSTVKIKSGKMVNSKSFFFFKTATIILLLVKSFC